MNSNLRLPLLLALTGFGLVYALISFHAQPIQAPVTIIREETVDGTVVCTAEVATSGGDFVEGVVGAPQYLNPLLNDFYPVDQQISALIFDGLVRYDDIAKRFVPALAERWEVSEDALSITFYLREDMRWHDGEPFTADDVIFTYQLLQQPDFVGSEAAHALWQTVSMAKVDEYTVSFRLAEAYAPFLEATTRGILPEHVLNGVTAVNLQSHPFNRFPIGTGPFMVDIEQDWTQTGRLRLLPNQTALPNSLLDSLSFQFYPDFDTLYDAFLAGELQGFGTVPREQLPAVLQQNNTHLVTNQTNRFTAVLFNLGESGNDALKTTTFRHALTQGTNRQTLVDTALNSQAVVINGPYLTSSWAYSPEIISSMSFNPISATAVLENEGWLIPEGGTVRQNEDERLTLQLVGLTQNRAVITQLAEQWQALGIEVEPSYLATGADLRTSLETGLFDVAVVDILPNDDPDLYDFWSQEAMIRGQNYGQWNNRRASEALESGRKVWGIEQRRPFYNTFLRIFNVELPAFTLYQHVDTYVVSDKVYGVDLGLMSASRDKYITFDQWYINIDERTVSCDQ